MPGAVLLVAATGVALVVALLLLLYLMSPLDHPKPLSLSGAHVVVTGGSSGIGKSIAIECFRQGAFLTLIARNEKRLLEAKKEIEKFSVNDKQ
ncbi:3-ketodihydrosphingosine reductase-like, partial [Python bivittatus]|uniref:3-ketodihydrosphingosine reductase-like n=1 Tax=Python bivittatus TaxID=176946 RepID=A0A9F2R8L6_PYTBI